MRKNLVLSFVVGCLIFCLSALALAGAGADFDQAFARIAAQIKASKTPEVKSSQGKPMLRAMSAPEKNTVKFELPLDKQGQGESSTSKRCFGVELICKARIVEPKGNFDVLVKTDAGSEFKFENLASEKPVDFKLKTNSGLSSTEFEIKIKSLQPPGTGQVVVAMDYKF